MKRFIMLLIIVVIIAAVMYRLVATYNGIVQAEKLVEEAEAQVGVVCQRRLDLIPNLVEVVKGYAKHERQVFIEITEARTKAQTVLSDMSSKGTLSEEYAEALSTSQSAVGQALRSLMVVVESYPDLKASANFRALQDQLEGTENRIAVERLRYNSAVRRYNTYIRVVPGNIIAGIFGFSEKFFLEPEDDAAGPVEIDF